MKRNRSGEKAGADAKRAIIGEYKVSIGCTDCGYKAHAWALEFDHKPEFKKWQSVGSLMYKPWDVIWAEIAKCEVVCCNCHAIRTYSRMQEAE